MSMKEGMKRGPNGRGWHFETAGENCHAGHIESATCDATTPTPCEQPQRDVRRPTRRQDRYRNPWPEDARFANNSNRSALFSELLEEW